MAVSAARGGDTLATTVAALNIAIPARLADALALISTSVRDRRDLSQVLATLAFRFEGVNDFGLAAAANDLAWRLAPDASFSVWSRYASATLTLLCRARQFDQAERFAAETDADKARRFPDHALPDPLIDIAWHFELTGDWASAVRCYRLALLRDRRTGDTRLTPDGDPLATKIRNLRVVQLRALVDDEAYEEAVALHESTRELIGAGPLRSVAIVTAAQAATATGDSYLELLPARPIEPCKVKFLGAPVVLTAEPGRLEAPAQYLALVTEALAYPRSNLVVQGDRAIYDLAADHRAGDIHIPDGLNPDQVMMATFGRGRLLVEEPATTLSFEAGLMMFGAQSRNYGHWFAEFVPRMLVYNDARCPADFPLVIDSGMPESHEEILKLIDTRSRPVIKLASTPARFKTLGIAPVPAFFPFDIKPGRTPYDTVWPRDIFAALGRLVRESIAPRGTDSRKGHRLFISRRAFNQRQLVNEAEIGKLLDGYGFETIFPETLTFVEQARLFSSAEIIIGSSSSALSNCIACGPGCTIIGLIHENAAFNFRAYTSFIEAGGARIVFIKGTTVLGDSIHPYHANYRIAPAQILEALKFAELA
ncbi:glycosyltransferase family 61 protein [Methylobacterium sp. A49B]